jgi:hypothetical protein
MIIADFFGSIFGFDLTRDTMSRFYQVQTHSQSLLLGTSVLNFYSRLRPFWLLVNLAGGRVAGQNVLRKQCAPVVLKDAQIFTFVDLPWPVGD